MHRDKLDNINYIVPDLHELFIDVKKLLNISVVSATIESLSDDPSLSSWVYQGLTLHKQKDAASCMFCNQKMLGERMSELEAHFNNEYENMLSRLKEELNRISEIREDLGKIKTPHVKELYEDIQDEYSQYEKMNQEQKLLIDKFLDGLGEKLREKKNRVFEKMPLDILVPEKSHKLFDGINSIIKKHNERSDIFEIDVEKARKSIEADHVAQNLEEYMNRKEDLDEAEKRVEKLDYSSALYYCYFGSC